MYSCQLRGFVNNYGNTLNRAMEKSKANADKLLLAGELNLLSIDI